MRNRNHCHHPRRPTPYRFHLALDDHHCSRSSCLTSERGLGWKLGVAPTSGWRRLEVGPTAFRDSYRCDTAPASVIKASRQYGCAPFKSLEEVGNMSNTAPGS